MPKFGKWLGGGLGWVLGGPIGAIVGYAVGTIYDNATLEPQPGSSQQNPRSNTAPGDFSMSLLVLCASVMKADGRVLKGELDYVRAFLVKNFGEAHARERLLLLRELLKQDFSVKDVCVQIRQHMDHPSRLQLLHLLFGLANADGHFHQQEMAQIELIANYLGVNPSDTASLRAMYYKDVKSSYVVLEVEEDVSDEELKKAYRRMAVKYHPDKVSHLGEDMQRAAKEKFQQLQEAYETIKKERGL